MGLFLVTVFLDRYPVVGFFLREYLILESLSLFGEDAF